MSGNAKKTEAGVVSKGKPGRKPGKMSPEQKEAARARKFAGVLNSKQITTVEAWKGVDAKQINAIVAVAVQAVEVAKSERVAALEAELAALKNAETPAQV